MSAFAINGLSSGIDTASLISQLMTVAAQPQTQLKNQLSVQQNVLSAYQAINTKLTALQTAADAVKQAGTWAATKAVSSSTAVVASTTSSATSGSATTFDVIRLATAQISTVAAAGTVVASPPNGIDIVDSAGVTHHLAIADGTAAGVATAVNNAALGIRASVISTDSGPLLQFTSVATGAAGAFTVNGLDTAPQTLVAARDAQIAVGNPAAGGYTVSSSSNTFNNVIPGVTFSIGAVATGVTVSVSSDASAISDKVKALVDATNAALAELGKDTGKGAVLESNYQINSITNSMLSTISRGSSGTSFASVGVQLTSTGTLAFDATAFASAYATDPAKAQATVATSLAGALSTLAMNTSTQIVSPLINSGTSQIGALNKQIADWDTRLDSQRTAMQNKYAAMEVALQKLQSTSSYLTSALAAISKSNSSSDN
ncbi:flagellar filament capping protein FliD [Jatrophihabitans sp.]|uniref:flagellar filament capping protein FliD n=1 Tax=Jatrophihabitans sp. TaxID=1932789 RepID=UPI002B510716|nr:flagellar filament capping protein FliD [Jatrophihabitans sp.]